MKHIVLAIALSLLPATGNAAEHWVSTCSTNPEYCSQKIVPMTAEEKKLLNDAEAAADKASEAALKAGAARDSVADKIVKLHHMERYPANVQHRNGFGGGTCTGKIEFNKDGYIIYTPSSDITACGDYKERSK